MRAIVFGLVWVIALPMSTIAKEKTKPRAELCPTNYAAELKAARGLPFEIYPIEGSDVGKFLKVFNAIEPKTDLKAEQILVAVTPQFAYVELFVGGCVDHEGKLGLPQFESLMGQAFGGELPNATAM